MLNSDSLLELLNNYQNFSILISIAISILIAVLGFLPSVFVTAANIVFFGPFYGFCISLLGEVIGGYICFLAYRKGFKKSTERFLGKYKLIDMLVHSEGKKIGFLIFQGRLLPFVPSGIVTLASALSNVSGTVFTVATFFGKIPSIALEVLISYQVINIEENLLNLVVTVIVLITLFFTLKKYYK